MLYLPDSARDDPQAFWGELGHLHHAIRDFGLPGGDTRENLSAIVQARPYLDEVNIVSALNFMDICNSLHADGAQNTRSHHDRIQLGFTLLNHPQAVAFDQRYLQLAQDTLPKHAQLNETGQTTDPATRTVLNQMALEWEGMDHPTLAAARDAAVRALEIQWLPRADFDRYWIDAILASDSFARKTDFARQETGATRSSFNDGLWYGLEAAGLRWYFDIWHFRIDKDSPFARLGQTRDGLRVLRYDEPEVAGTVLSWPDLDELHQITAQQRPLTPQGINLCKFDAALARVLPLQQSLDRRVGGTLAGLIATFLRPASTYRMFLTLGGWGMSDLTLLRHVITACLAVVGLWAAFDYADAPGWAAILTDPDRPTSLRLRALVPVVSTLLLCVAGLASLIRATALLHGTLLRALGHPPVDGTTNLPDTGKSNFILRLFGHKP